MGVEARMHEIDGEGIERWSARQFGDVELGDRRRNARVRRMAAAACARPSGKVAAVFKEDRDQQAAYDLLESEHVEVGELVGGIASASARACQELPFVFVPVDGTSVSVVDQEGEHDFGRLGADSKGGRGLKVIDALAVDPEGTPVGLVGLTWWARSARKSPPRGSHARQSRAVDDKETAHWLETIKQASRALDEHRVRGWFQIDREGDGRDVLLALAASEHWWTVRGNADRSIELEHGDKDMLRSELSRQPIAGTYLLEVVARPNQRRERQARMVVRVAQVLLRLRNRANPTITRLPVTAVWAHEQGTTPPGEDPIDWLLYTNSPVASYEDAIRVVRGYSMRWRIEEFHRTWKRGEADVESTQLGSASAVQIWATILATVAVRIERLKRLARARGHLPASIDFSRLEIKALKLLKFGATPPTDQPTIAEAVAWIAELGGFAGKYSGKPPGATVLGRGLRYLRPAARLLEIQEG